MGTVYTLPVYSGSDWNTATVLRNNGLLFGIQKSSNLPDGYLYMLADSPGIKLACWNDTSTGNYKGYVIGNGIAHRNYAYPDNKLGSGYTVTANETQVTMFLISSYSLPTSTGYEVILDLFESEEAARNALLPVITYPITYSSSNSTVSGPSEAAVGDTVTVSAVPDNNYGITNAASQILVTNNDVAVPYQWNPSTNTITFTMPDPS